VRDLARAEARAFDTMVLTQRVHDALPREEADGVAVVRFPYFWRRWEDVADGATFENVRARPSRLLQLPCLFVAQAVALRRAVKAFEPDVVHLYWLIPQGIAALVAGRGRRWLMTCPGVDVYALNSRPWRALKRAIIRRCALVTTMNDDMRERLVALGAPVESTLVLPMGVDLERVRRRPHPAPAPGAILFAGRLVEKKGLAVLLDALDLVGSDGWHLRVVGDGPLRATLEARAAGAGDRIEFLGELASDELAAEYHRAEVVVIPSVPARSGDQDGLPVVLLEAMAAGRPVIASRLPGLDAAVTDSVDGRLIPPGDAAALATALTELLADTEQRARLGAAARQRAEAFGVDAVGRRYVDLLERIIAAPAPTGRRQRRRAVAM
jgi:glycosyltransferase involved in cell wall biosynthesis